ncbi:MAG: DUF2071 domain-containing protein [Dehalococcoidales bacterium]|nr:DUF2071 domain-containing protein [Dehalococcoidales bacterium]
MNNNATSLSYKNILSRPLSVRMTLRDVIYISYALPVKILQPLVPSALRLATVGSDIAFISLVVLRCTRVRLSAFPLVNLNYNQLNIRTYVTDPISGRPAVYFIESGVTSRLVSFATSSIGIPWQLVELMTELTISEEVRYLSIWGDWDGRFSFKVQSDINVAIAPLYFENEISAVDFLIRPLIGFAGDDRRLVGFTIQHPEVQPENWSLTELDFPLLKKLMTIDDFKDTHSVFYLPTADFSIFLPPTRIKKKG